MTLFESIAGWLFEGAVFREQQRTRAYAALALATWRRHRDGDLVEGPESMREVAEFILDLDGHTCMRNHTTQHAFELLLELDDDEEVR